MFERFLNTRLLYILPILKLLVKLQACTLQTWTDAWNHYNKSSLLLETRWFYLTYVTPHILYLAFIISLGIYNTLVELVGNKAKGKSRAYQRVRNVCFQKIWRALFPWNTRFEIRPFASLPTNSMKVVFLQNLF